MGKRNLYLTNTPVREAQEIYKAALEGVIELRYEVIATQDSLGRVTKEAVFAKYCSPLFNAAAMDGIAVITDHTKGASEKTPVVLTEGEDYVQVDTGDPIKPPFDGVIMAEDLLPSEEGSVKIMAAAAPWQHIRPIGEDIVVGEMILPGHHQIRAIDIGVLLSAGITQIEVVKVPKVAIFPTGTEIIEPDQEPGEGDIIESNTQMFGAMVTEAGGEPHRFAPIADDYETIKAYVADSVKDHDLVIVNAGSSAGRDDYTVHVLRELGEVLIHGVAIKPGKPVILALVGKTPVIGLPGYPVSAYIGFENFVLPALALMSGRLLRSNKTVEAIMSKRLISSLKHKEYVRVKVGQVGGRLVAAPLARGAGAAMSLVRADGFCVIEQNQEGVEAGESVKVELYRDLEAVQHTLVVIGSHDLILDVLADLIPNHYPGNFLSSTHVGSMGGLMALKRGEAHLAPIHLLDEEEGVYNIPYLKRFFSEPMALIKGVGRLQGLIVKKGNPKGFHSLADLKGASFINRQRGSGTRVLFDYKLKELGILPEEITGYEREGATHMAVAAAVSSDSADVGVGILSAAKALDLDFVEIATEEYEFALPAKNLELPQVQAFIEALKSQEFKESLQALGGYDWEGIGEVTLL